MFLAALLLVPWQTPPVPVPAWPDRRRPKRGARDPHVAGRDGPPWSATFSLDPAQPLVTSIGPDGEPVVRSARPFYRGETGKRRGGWYAFFDDPASHPDGTRHVQSEFMLKADSARSAGCLRVYLR